MTADDIRRLDVINNEFFLREIAAQLAELNARSKKRDAEIESRLSTITFKRDSKPPEIDYFHKPDPLTCQHVVGVCGFDQNDNDPPIPFILCTKCSTFFYGRQP